jgi:sugar transferase (PEP-CTERM/EpsH1 system associated)
MNDAAQVTDPVENGEMFSEGERPARPSSPLEAEARYRPLIAHVIYRLDVGGLENGLVNLINRTPQYRHAIICMTDYTDFSRRITHPAVSLYSLDKHEGKDFGVYIRLWRLLRSLRPDIVHTRNLAALEGQLPAALAGVHGRVHGEHGWDVHDLDGSSRKYRWLRRGYRSLVQRYIPLSRELERYLRQQIKVDDAKISQIYNGVDTVRFHPAQEGREHLPTAGFAPPGAVIIGTVGRMQAVKDPLNLVRAFLRLADRDRSAGDRLRLVMIGDGPLRSKAQSLLAEQGMDHLAWLPGSRDDIPELLRGMDLFVLPSRAEGISNTILEAMASGLPVVATRVGGNGELIEEGVTGALANAGDPPALAEAIDPYLRDPLQRQRHGRAGRERVEREFSIEAMIEKYNRVYQSLLEGVG